MSCVIGENNFALILSSIGTGRHFVLSNSAYNYTTDGIHFSIKIKDEIFDNLNPSKIIDNYVITFGSPEHHCFEWIIDCIINEVEQL